MLEIDRVSGQSFAGLAKKRFILQIFSKGFCLPGDELT